VPPSDVVTEIASRVVRAVGDGFGRQISLEDALVRPAAAGRDWDYQINVAMGLAKRTGLSSRDVATGLVDRLGIDDLAEVPTIGGPGFINIRVRNSWIEERLAEQLEDDRLGIPAAVEPMRAVVDYSAPNVAKEMHVGHLRSTIIGDALARILRHVGHDVVPQNHIGDWGTPFGMLIEHLLEEGGDAIGDGEHSIRDLNAFYQAARAKFDADPVFRERSRRRVVELQRGDPTPTRLWRALVVESERHFDEVYRLLGVLLAHEDLAPESIYNELLPEVVRELDEKGLTVVSDGATCVFPPGFSGRDGEPLPLIVRKQDGGYTYDTTDLAAIKHRVEDLHADTLLYVVGAPQRMHFEMVFAAARMAGWLPEDVPAHHVAFGSVLGEDGKILRTRAGAPVRLVDLLHEAIARSTSLLDDREHLGDDDKRRLARAIGIGAVKYADLSNDRERDYVFSFERMLALEGNTSVYLQYANARAQSVLARAGGRDPDERPAFSLVEPAERELALRLLRLPVAVGDVLADMRPNKLCNYLYDTAVAFSVFYERCPVLAAGDDELRRSRLALCELTSRVLSRGLELLGIEAPRHL
jgi:arginyl-tRNA synthetase